MPAGNRGARRHGLSAGALARCPAARWITTRSRPRSQRLQTAAGVESHTGRSLTLFSTPITAGGILRAVLQFSSLFSSGMAARWSAGSTPAIRCFRSAWFPVAEFAPFYDIVRHERPLRLHWEMRDAGADAGFLRHLALGTKRKTTSRRWLAELLGLFGVL